MNLKELIGNKFILISVLCIVLVFVISGVVTNYTMALNGKNSRINTLQNQVTTDSAEITNLQNQINSLNAQISKLQSEGISSSSQVTNLQNEVNSLNSQITQLNLYINNIVSLHSGFNGAYLTNTQISNYYGTGLLWAIDANTTINNLLGPCTVTITFITQNYSYAVSASSSTNVEMHWEGVYQDGDSLSISAVNR